MTLTTHHLEFTATALTPLELDDQAGASIRGAVVGGLWERFCTNISYSSRSRQRTPIGGLVGQVTLAGDLAPLRELLVWGSLIHVGKNAVKGDGWYRIGA